MKRHGVKTKTGDATEASRMSKTGRDIDLATGRMGPASRSQSRMKKGGVATKKGSKKKK